MTLTKIALQAVRGSSPEFRGKLAEALKVEPRTLRRYLQANADELTKMAALQLISAELGVPVEDLVESVEAQS